MTTIRICEESEARLMIRDGSFMEYIKKWSERYPQEKKMALIKDLHSKKGFGLLDSLMVARAMGVDEAVVFEVGENMCIKKINDKFEVFQRIEGIWVGYDNGLSVLDSEDIFMVLPCPRFAVCEEKNLLQEKAVSKLAKSIVRRLKQHAFWNGLMPFGKHELWQFDVNSSQIKVFSHSLETKSLYLSEEDIAEHIRRYRESYKGAFGSF